MDRPIIETIICDLAEVIIWGLMGVEKRILPGLNLPADTPLLKRGTHPGHFGGENFQKLLTGQITEIEYWLEIIKENGYPETAENRRIIHFLKLAVRENFIPLDGTQEILRQIDQSKVKLCLLSDHCAEWITHIEYQFPFLPRIFPVRIYSYETGVTKRSPESFKAALETVSADPRTTLFIDDQMTNLEVASSPEVRIKYSYQFLDAPKLESTLKQFNVI